MPQENLSAKMGTSTSPLHAKVIDANKNVQQPVPLASAIPAAHNKHPVK